MLIYKKKTNFLYNFFIKFKKIFLKLTIFSFFLILIIFSIYIGGILQKNGTFYELKNSLIEAPYKLSLEIKSFINNEPKIYIDIGFKDFKRIEYSRNKNLLKGIGSYEDQDWVNAKIKFKNEEYNTKIRLKGVYSDHWESSYKWSYRLKIKEGKTLFGNNELTMQDPLTRDFLLEWVFMKMLSDEGIINHRVKLVEVIMNGQSLGLYLFADHFSKYLIEANKRRNAPIISFNKDSFVYNIQQGHEIDYKFEGIGEYNFLIAPLEIHSINKNNSINLDLAEIGLKKLEAFRSGRIKTSEIFDYKAIAKIKAIRILLGSDEFDWRDIKFYLNPMNQKLEPIDKEIHSRFQPHLNDMWVKYMTDFQKLLFSDMVFLKEFQKQLYDISSKKFIDNFYETHDSELKELLNKINKFQDYNFPYHKIEDRRKYIRQQMNNLFAINAYITHINQDDVTIKITSTQPFATEIGCIKYKKKPILCPQNKYLLKGNNINETLKYNLLSMKWQVENFDIISAINNISLDYNIIGNSNQMQVKVRYGDIESINLSKKTITSTKDKKILKFANINHENKIINFHIGKHIITNNIIFPKKYKVYIYSGTEIVLDNHANLVFQGPTIMKGSTDDPILINSSKKKGGGLIFLNTEKSSHLNNVIFNELSTPRYNELLLTGAITFYESDVEISDTLFKKNNSGDDYLNIIRSNFKMNDSIFETSLFDAFDSDFSKGVISNVVIQESGNDALDFSGSEVIIDNILVNNVKDKALSVGEESKVKITNSKIMNSKYGLVSKDNSKIIAHEIEFKEVNFVGVAFQKKNEFGPSEIEINNNNQDIKNDQYIVDNVSKIYLENGKLLRNINSNLIKEIYSN